MASRSSPIRSTQALPDRALEARRARRAGSAYRRPLAPHNLTLYRQLADWLRQQTRPLLLDSGCGTGTSTRALAATHPQHAVIGIDKSLSRLARQGLSAAQPLLTEQRVAFVLGDLVDLWRLLAADAWPIERHYLLYPNPWPRPAQRLRRWPLHPLWPLLLGLAPQLELRCNWRLYAEETVHALTAEGWQARLQCFQPVAGSEISPFEAKYHASGHPLYRVIGWASPRACPVNA